MTPKTGAIRISASTGDIFSFEAIDLKKKKKNGRFQILWNRLLGRK